MVIDPTETVITGGWVLQGQTLVPDRNCERIEQLTSTHLRFVKLDESGWDRLYLNPTDGACWERTYPQSEMHGGGPPQLRRLSLNEARSKYGDWSPLEKSK